MLKFEYTTRHRIDGYWLRKTQCVEHRNTQDCNLDTRDRNVFQNERVEIANPCVLVSTHTDLSVFVSRLCPATESRLKINHSFGETIQCVAFVSTLRFALISSSFDH